MNSKRLILTKVQLDEIADGLMRAEPKFKDTRIAVFADNYQHCHANSSSSDSSFIARQQEDHSRKMLANVHVYNPFQY